MKPSEILREAAKQCEDDLRMYRGEPHDLFLGACDYISSVARDPLTGHHDRSGRAAMYLRRFKPKDHGTFWWPAEPSHGPRILALCFAAAMAESDGR